ncbi:MAG: Mur ligase family protein [Solirubrobacterales bacterium]|nr:Mur ligase family protein [Solirubrobacterales bacterium]MCB8915123.1 Mur ligase family protein [Thermoleophilales bacterium]
MIGFKAWIARSIGRLSRATGRGGGTTLPGRVLLKLDPNAIDKLGARLSEGTTLISATNGKTTTASMLATILEGAGRRPVHNRAGSNMTWGVATALLEQHGTEGLFEVDEAWLPEVADRLEPRTILLGNLFRDQLDRYGETEALADAWADLATRSADRSDFVLNADDPLIADIGNSSGPGTSYFGIADESQALSELQHAFDAKLCRVCGHELTYDRAFVGHLGHYHCESCGMRRPEPDVSANRITLRGMSGVTARIDSPEGSSKLELPLPGLYNLYNALGAISTARQMGVPVEASVRSLASMKAVFGRVERIRIKETTLSILLIKNPAGANEVIRTLSLEPAPVDLWIALNDRIADGRDVSWIWDADFEMLADRIGKVTCTGTRASEMALRLKYAGWPADRVEVIGNLEEALDRALGGAKEALFALPTYTALLDLRKLLADRGDTEKYWEG